MSVKFSKLSMMTALSLGVSVFAFSSSAMAASCLSGASQASPAASADFQKDPASLLKANPASGLSLSNAVRSLAGSDSANLADLVALAEKGTTAQKTAIATGLSRAASACKDIDPDYALKIQQAVAGSGNLDMMIAYRTASNDTFTATITPGGGAGSGGEAGAGGGGGTGGAVGGGGGGGATGGTDGGGAASGGGGNGTSTTTSNANTGSNFSGGRTGTAVVNRNVSGSS
ncbi:MAG: hypothetical protein OIF56_07705 [Cohaesibacter sp.]|nr:hypothetical protein [Cohaesibacter sp.]